MLFRYKPEEIPMLFAQITDTHINTLAHSPFKGRCADKQLAAVIHFLNTLTKPPLFVLLTGDCVHEGNLQEYLKLQQLLQKLNMPCFIIPGNHDNRDLLKECFPEVALLCQDPSFMQYVIEDFPLRLIALDTLSEGNTFGELCQDRLAWLDNTLAKAPSRPTALFMHHPPAIYGLDILDKNANHHTTELATILENHSQVQYILCGHFHSPCHTLWQNKVVTVAGSTLVQFSLDVGTKPLQWSDEPPSLALHRWQKSRLVTHFCSIPLVL